LKKIEKLPSNNCFNLVKPFVMVCAEQQGTNHANPSLRSGQALKLKPMLDCRLRRKKIHA